MSHSENTRVVLLRRKEVQARTGLPTSSLYALIKKGQFPTGVKLSAKAVAWSSEAVQTWVDSRVASAESRLAA